MIKAEDWEILGEWKLGVERFVVQDIRGSLDRNFLEVGLIILTLIGIDCVSGYYAGKPSERSTFEQFIASKYFPADYHNRAGDLYDLRNGLVHDYTIKSNRFHFFRNTGDGYPHLGKLVTQKGTQITLNREEFARDFLNAWEMYSNDVFATQDLAVKALARIKEEGRGFLIVGEIRVHPASEGDFNQNNTQYSGGTVNYPLS